MEKQYMAKFAFVFYELLVFGNMFTTFFAYFTVLEQFLFTRVFLNSPLTSLQGTQNLAQHVRLFFTFSFKLNLFIKTAVLVRATFLEMQGEQCIPETIFTGAIKSPLKFSKN